MKIKGFFMGEKRFIRKWIYISFVFFVIGITIGAIYCILLDTEADNTLNSYFIKYFSDIRGKNSSITVFKNTLVGYTRLAVIIYLCSFVRPGVVGSIAVVVIKGFTSGFTNASLIKYFGVRGLLIPGVSFLTVLLYLPALLVMTAGSVNCSLNRYKGERGQLKAFTGLAICCFTIFCAASLSDAYITTTFMKLIARFFTE